MPALRSRLDAAERATTAYAARAPWMVEHAPDGSVRFRMNGAEHELTPDAFAARFPGVRCLTWAVELPAHSGRTGH